MNVCDIKAALLRELKQVLPPLLCVVCILSRAAAGSAENTVIIRGTVKSTFMGQVVPVRRIRVYAFDKEKHEPIIRILEKIQLLPREKETPEAIERFVSLYRELVSLVEAAKKKAPQTQTNQDGEFELPGLALWREYLVLAIAPEAEGELSYFGFVSTEKLKQGKHEVQLTIY